MGPVMYSTDLTVPFKVKFILKISQTIDSDQDNDNNCENYPYNKYSSYRECDEDFLYQTFTKEYNNLMPFWVTDNFNDVTRHRYLYFYPPLTACILLLYFP